MTGWDDASRLCTLDDGRSGWVLLTLGSFGDFVRASVGGFSRGVQVDLLEALRTVLASCDVLRMKTKCIGAGQDESCDELAVRASVELWFFRIIKFLTVTLGHLLFAFSALLHISIPRPHHGPRQTRSTQGTFHI